MKGYLVAWFTLGVVALELRAPAQGAIYLDNIYVTNRVDIGSPGSRYTGTFGMELWMLNSTDLPPALNTIASLSGVAAYRSLSADGFLLEQTFINQPISQGVFRLSEAYMHDVSPGGRTVVLALAAWNSSAPSWSAMLAGAGPNTGAGVIAFVQPTVDFTLENPGSPPVLAWGVNQDLVMLPVPEPGTCALLVLGVALLLWRQR